jgi:hypothetical protein
MGYKKVDSDDIPAGYEAVKFSEPYPVSIFGERKPIADTSIGKYLNTEFYYYLNIYRNIKLFGLPYKSWLDCPRWLLYLLHLFDDIEKEYEKYKLSKKLI